MKIARRNKRAQPANSKIILKERELHLNLFQKVNILRYRESVFKAASKLTTSL